VIDTGEAQGNVLYAYGDRYRFARYVLLRIDNRESARARLRGWFDKVSFGRRPWDTSADGRAAPGDLQGLPPGTTDAPHVSVAFTFSGLEKLRVPDDHLYAFPDEFRQGARKRSVDNGDIGDSASERWIEHFGTGDVLLVVHAVDAAARDELVERLLTDVNGGMTTLHDLPAARLGSEQPFSDEGVPRVPRVTCNTTPDREPFGFADGCSQPAIEGVHDNPIGGGAYVRVPLRWWRRLQWVELLMEDLGIRSVGRRWRPIRAGEFLLGYENEDGELPAGPPAPLGPNGTFMVYRPMRQDVDGFKHYVKNEAERLELDPEFVRAKIVGRWPDGTPLTLSPERPDPLVASDRFRANDFLYTESVHGYEADTDGYGCPLGAHVRRSNPRDALPGGGERTMRHRIIRRGMPYGKASGSEEAGLAFVCYSASIRDGFEFILRTWCNSGAELGLRQRDLLLQQGNRGELTGMVIQRPGDKTAFLRPPDRPFVTVLGCEYLFVPSRRACQWLASLT
jgi:Dyp-type peroxidase family